jgi:hypothetical protein
VRSTHKIPFKTARRSFQGRPRLSSRRGGSGIRSFRVSHCVSVRSRVLAAGIEFTPRQCAQIIVWNTSTREAALPRRGAATKRAVAHDARIPLQTTIAEAAIRACQPSATVGSEGRAAFASVLCAPAAIPVPLRDTDCGLPAALSEMLSTAVRVPDAVGLNVTLMLQLAPAAKELPQVCVWAKSAALIPTIAMAVMVRLAVPVFLSATIFALLVVSIACVGNVRLVGDRATIGAEVEIVLVNFWSGLTLACGSVGAGSPPRYPTHPAPAK